MKRIIQIVLFVMLLLCQCMSGYTEENTRFELTIGNVVFDATVSGGEVRHASTYLARLKVSESENDGTVIDIFDKTIFAGAVNAYSYEEDELGGGEIERYYIARNGSREYCFHDGAIILLTAGSDYYTEIMDITAPLSYDGERYIPGRLESGDFPFMASNGAAEEVRSIAERLGLNVQNEPYIIRAYSMDDELLTQNGIHEYLQYIIQGNDLTAESRAFVRENGSNCYYIAYRYEFDGIPMPISYFYIESKDYFTLPSYLIALYNDNGIIRFFSYNQLELMGEVEPEAIITFEEAAKSVADNLNMILGVESFVCREIELEYVPIANKGQNPDREACLIPMWVFYFEDNASLPILINAYTGKVFE